MEPAYIQGACGYLLAQGRTSFCRRAHARPELADLHQALIVGDAAIRRVGRIGERRLDAHYDTTTDALATCVTESMLSMYLRARIRRSGSRDYPFVLGDENARTAGPDGRRCGLIEKGERVVVHALRR